MSSSSAAELVEARPSRSLATADLYFCFWYVPIKLACAST